MDQARYFRNNYFVMYEKVSAVGSEGDRDSDAEAGLSVSGAVVDHPDGICFCTSGRGDCDQSDEYQYLYE